MIDSANVVSNGYIKMPYNWSAGDTGSHFLTQLRDYKRIWGTQCPSCKRVYLPPRNHCFSCFVSIGDWVELKPEGVLITYTVLHYHEPALHPFKSPLIYGLIKLDGSDTAMLHIISGVKSDDIYSGMRVKAVFAEERKGSPLDIQYFKPVV